MLRILIVKPSSLGDLVHTAPAVDYLAKLEPAPRISWIVHESYVELVREFPGVGEVIPFPRGLFRAPALIRRLPEAIRWVRGLRRGFDVAADFQGLHRSGLMARLSGAKERFGFRDARELAWIHYNHRLPRPAHSAHEVDRHLTLACAVRDFLIARGLARLPPSLPAEPSEWLATWRLEVPRAHANFGTRALGEGPPAIALCPSGRWDSKRWPAERWAELACALWEGEPRLRAILVCGPSEKAEAERIAALVGNRAPLQAWVGSTSFWETASLLARTSAVVGVDSFPLHLAWALGVPTVGLFGPSTPERIGPRGERHVAVSRTDLACIGCWKHRCPLPEWRCMPGISSDEVLRAIHRVRA